VRLKYARIGHTQLDDVDDFEYGFNLETLQKFRDHWLNKYNWRKWEAKLNELPQFTTEIEGLKVRSRLLNHGLRNYADQENHGF
jgi:hypothetical protein